MGLLSCPLASFFSIPSLPLPAEGTTAAASLRDESIVCGSLPDAAAAAAATVAAALPLSGGIVRVPNCFGFDAYAAVAVLPAPAVFLAFGNRDPNCFGLVEPDTVCDR